MSLNTMNEMHNSVLGGKDKVYIGNTSLVVHNQLENSKRKNEVLPNDIVEKKNNKS